MLELLGWSLSSEVDYRGHSLGGASATLIVAALTHFGVSARTADMKLSALLKLCFNSC